MQVTTSDGIFVAISRFEEKDIPKGAGMRWNSLEKRWESPDWRVARQLADYCDAEAEQLIQHMRGLEATGIEASHADYSDIVVPAPEGLAYLPFQLAGVAYALDRRDTIIGDDMGLGKSIEALGLINANAAIKRVLIVCPASIKTNWQREAEKWLVRPMTVGIVGKQFPEADVTIISYDVLRKYRAELRREPYDLVVMDECHRLKNAKAQRTQEAFGHWDPKPENRIPSLPARQRVLMTGTPIVNRPYELWPILKAFGWTDWKAYVTRYCCGSDTEHGWSTDGASHLDELQEKLRATCLIRRRKQDVLKELPPKRRQILTIDDPESAAIVAAEAKAWKIQQDQLLALQLAVELAKSSASDEEYRQAAQALNSGLQVAFNEMSKARYRTAMAKVPRVVEHLLEAVASSGRVVVFAHHHDVINEISARLSAAGITSVKLTGEMTLAARQDSVDRFQSQRAVKQPDGRMKLEPIPGPAPRVFIGSIQAAGVGITLTAASHVLFAELDWTPGNMSQAEDRCYRIGQLESVLVQHLVLDGSLDADMATRLVEKQDVIDHALDLPGDEQEEVKSWGSMLTTGEAATRNNTRAQIAKEALQLTSEQITTVHRQLRQLADLCDGAHSIDGLGFDKVDTRLGHDLAGQDHLTPKQAALGRRLVRKYVHQLEAFAPTE